MTNASMRASDDDRERTVTVLREAFGEGRLTLDEFDERTSGAYAAKTWGDLRALTEDLPLQPEFELDTASRQPDLPYLPQVRPEAIPPAMANGVRRGRPLGPLLPIMFIAAIVAGNSGSPATAAALACILVCLIAIRLLSGGHR